MEVGARGKEEEEEGEAKLEQLNHLPVYRKKLISNRMFSSVVSGPYSPYGCVCVVSH